MKLYDYLDAIDVLKHNINVSKECFNFWFDIYTKRREMIEQIFTIYEGQKFNLSNYIIDFGELLWNTKFSNIFEDQFYNLDRCVYLKLALSSSFIALIRYLRGIYKNARIIITGRSGVGKTAYASLAAYGCYRILGLDEELSWELVKHLTFHRTFDFIEFLYAVVSEDVFVPFVIIDEAIIVSKYWILRGKKEREAFSSFLEIIDLIKDWIGTLVFTTPHEMNIAKRIRDIIDVKIYGEEIVDENNLKLGSIIYITKRITRDYITRTIDRRVIHKVKTDEVLIDIDVIPWNIRLPSNVWKKHLESRKEMVLEKLKEFIQKMIEIKEKVESETEEVEEKGKEKVFETMLRKTKESIESRGKEDIVSEFEKSSNEKVIDEIDRKIKEVMEEDEFFEENSENV